MFNLFKKKTPETSAGEKEALLKMKALEEWPPPPDIDIPTPEVKPPKEEPEEEEVSIADLLIKATKEKRIVWKRFIGNENYTKLGFFMTLKDGDYFVIEENMETTPPINYTLTYFSGSIMTKFCAGEYNPEHTELWDVVYGIELENHNKALSKAIDYLEEKETKE